MEIETIAMILVAMVVIVGFVMLLYKIGVSREKMILAALITGLVLGTCIGNCFGQFVNSGPLNSSGGGQNYFDNQNPQARTYMEPGYHTTSPYYTTPQTTNIFGVMWNQMKYLWEGITWNGGRKGGNGARPPSQQN